jgi:hypothetical protein
MTLRTYEFYTIMTKSTQPNGEVDYIIDSDIHYTFRDKARTAAGLRAKDNKAKVFIVRCQVVETIDDREEET